VTDLWRGGGSEATAKLGACLRRAMKDSLHTIRSSVAGMAWPALPAGMGATLLALQYQLEQTQWWTPERLRQHQFHQLESLLSHAWQTAPFHRERLDAAGFQPGMDITEAWFAALPRLTRAEVHALGSRLHCHHVPAAHEPVTQGQTSGSTGTPVSFLSTAVTRLFWQSFNLRDHLWHGRDLGLKLATIRPDRGVRGESGVTVPYWSPPLAEICRNGPSAVLHSANTLDRQIDWLVEQDPEYLLTLASNLLELARDLDRRGIRLARLREARTFGDVLSAAARAECMARLRVKVVDMYTSQEAGYIALQCPDHDHYHVQSEGVIVEVLDDDGRPCAPGGIGKVVVTTLHNYAMPLIRYEIGDMAEAGAPCPCRRGLPVIRRVLGRERNLAMTPDGRKYHPSFAAEVWSQIAPIRQLQLVQKTLGLIEVRLAAARNIDGGETHRLAAALRRSLGYPYEFRFVRLENIPRAASGKYEDFICEVA
jgi:phenylacetate-CoA ligase